MQKILLFHHKFHRCELYNFNLLTKRDVGGRPSVRHLTNHLSGDIGRQNYICRTAGTRSQLYEKCYGTQKITISLTKEKMVVIATDKVPRPFQLQGVKFFPL